MIRSVRDFPRSPGVCGAQRRNISIDIAIAATKMNDTDADDGDGETFDENRSRFVIEHSAGRE